MSVQVLSWVLENSKARLGARLVLIAVANHASHEGDNAFPSVTTIAKESLLSERQARYCLRQLEASGELLVKRRASHFGTNLYSFAKYKPTGGAGIAPSGADIAPGVGQNPPGLGQSTAGGGAVDCPLTVLQPSEPPKSKTKPPASRGANTAPDPSSEKKANPKDVVSVEGVSLETWAAFREMRKAKDRPLTPKAISLLMRKLLVLKSQGYDPNEVLEESIVNAWTSVYPLKRGTNGSNYRGNSARPSGAVAARPGKYGGKSSPATL
jgi:hypothetical protein